MKILVEEFSVDQVGENDFRIIISGNELPSSLQRKIAKSMVKSDKPYTNALAGISVWDNRYNMHRIDYSKILLAVNIEDLGTLDTVRLYFINNEDNEIKVDFIFVSEDNTEHLEKLVLISDITDARYYGGFEFEDKDKDLWIKDFDNVTKEEIIDVLNDVVTEFLLNI